MASETDLDPQQHGPPLREMNNLLTDLPGSLDLVHGTIDPGQQPTDRDEVCRGRSRYGPPQAWVLGTSGISGGG